MKKNQRIPGIRSFLIIKAEPGMKMEDQKSGIELSRVNQAKHHKILVQTTLNQLGFVRKSTNRDGNLNSED